MLFLSRLFLGLLLLGNAAVVSAAEARNVQIAEEPLPFNELMDRFSQEIAYEMERSSLNRAGMIEFTTVSEQNVRTLARNDYLSFPLLCASRLERKIQGKLSGETFKVLSSEQTQRALKSAGLEPNGLFSKDGARTVKEVTINGKPLACLIVGTFVSLEGKNLGVKCGVWDIFRMRPILVVAGVAALSVNELGAFKNFFPKDALNELKPSETASTKPVAPSRTEWSGVSRPTNKEKAKKEKEEEEETERQATAEDPIPPRPVFSPEFSFPVDVQVRNPETDRYETRPIEIVNGQLYVPLRLDEVYQIVIKNKTESEVALRLLVDGLNTHPERIDGETTVGARVGLDEARFWILRPTRPTRKDPNAEGAKIRGFYERVGDSGSLREFTVTTIEESLGARREFTDFAGDITLAFYSLLPSTRGGETKGIATGLGNRVSDSVQVFGGREVDRPLSIYHLRYATPEAIAVMKGTSNNE